MRRNPKSEKNEAKSKDIILLMVIKKENKLSHKKYGKGKNRLRKKIEGRFPLLVVNHFKSEQNMC